MKRILILDDNITICLMLKSWLVKQNYKVETATSVEEAKQKVKSEAYDLILSDIRMPESDGFSFLSWVQKFDSDILVIMMTGYADIETAVESMKSGAADYIAKPIEAELLYKKIDDAIKSQENQKKMAQFRELFIKPPGDVYKNIFDKLHEIVQTESHILIIGEQGTGKTAAAKYVYSKLANDLSPFVVLDCESNGAGSNGDRMSCGQALTASIEKANGGLLVIKNIQRSDLNLQTLLLNAVTKQKKNDRFTQIIITSQANKQQLKSSLLPKLYDVLTEKHLELPVLKNNNEAILFYMKHFLNSANQELDRNIEKIDNEVVAEFIKHPWEGNIQELKNMIFKACLLADGKIIGKNILPQLFKRLSDTEIETPQANKSEIDMLKKENYEKAKIKEALEIANGNKTMAASILNIDRKTLYNKIKLYKVDIS